VPHTVLKRIPHHHTTPAPLRCQVAVWHGRGGWRPGTGCWTHGGFHHPTPPPVPVAPPSCQYGMVVTPSPYRHLAPKVTFVAGIPLSRAVSPRSTHLAFPDGSLHASGDSLAAVANDACGCAHLQDQQDRVAVTLPATY